MDPLIISIITYMVITLGVWAGGIALITGRIIVEARQLRGAARTSDILVFLVTAVATIVTFIVVFIWPGLIHMIPSTVAFVGIGLIPLLGYMTEIGYKHWKRLHKLNSVEVDEHATIR